MMRLSVEHPTDRPNFCIVRLPSVQVAFSYETPIAFAAGGEWKVRQNHWSATTGKHLNYLDNGEKKDRLDDEAWWAEFNAVTSRVLANGERIWTL